MVSSFQQRYQGNSMGEGIIFSISGARTKQMGKKTEPVFLPNTIHKITK